VVLVRFPDSSGDSAKFRPALVVQATHLETDLDQVILAMISSTLRQGPARVPVAANSSPAKQMGLRLESVIYCDVVQTIETRHINRVVGSCPLMAEVNDALRVSLDLP
jgi:mRNA interferase MazF